MTLQAAAVGWLVTASPHHEGIADGAQRIWLRLHMGNEADARLARFDNKCSPPIASLAVAASACRNSPCPDCVQLSLTAISICRGARSQGATSLRSGAGGGVGVPASAAGGASLPPVLPLLLGCCSARTANCLRCMLSAGRPAACRRAAWPKATVGLQCAAGLYSIAGAMFAWMCTNVASQSEECVVRDGSSELHRAGACWAACAPLMRAIAALEPSCDQEEAVIPACKRLQVHSGSVRTRSSPWALPRLSQLLQQ